MTYTKDFLNKLRNDIIDAIAETMRKFENEISMSDDCGTCNFDMPHIFLKGLRATTAAKVGLRPFYGGGFTFVHLHLQGQASWRTRMAEAMQKAMRQRGYETTYVYYVMD